MAKTILEFEKPLIELENKIQEMELLSTTSEVDMSSEIEKLKNKSHEMAIKINKKLSRWQRVELARHADRPHALDYIERIVSKWNELHGDRNFGDDHAIITGIGHIGEFKAAIIGQQKGRSTKDNIYRNFGMASPEGFRKALRVMKLAEKFNIPVISFVDTIGAFPGLEAEERGQAEAIARNLLVMSKLKVPIIIVVIGEGASGGALGVGVGDRLLMLENTWFSVISPEGCASILYRDAGKKEQAAESMKVTAQDLLEMGIADRIIPEPLGGAHKHYDETAEIVKKTIIEELHQLVDKDKNTLISERIEKLEKIGSWG